MATDGSYSLDEIADRLAIGQVIARYVHALDARDYDTLDDVFLPDTRFDLTEGGGIAGSWAEVKRYYQDNLEAFVDYQHVFSNVLLEFDIGRRRARSRADDRACRHPARPPRLPRRASGAIGAHRETIVMIRIFI
jgi:hypothetical protein